MATVSKVQNVKVSDIHFDPSLNPQRDASDYGDPELFASILREQGILDPLDLVEVNGRIEIGKGNRRFLANELNRTLYPKGYARADGTLVEFDTVPARIHKGLTEDEILTMRGDAGNQVRPSEAGLFSLTQAWFAKQKKEKEVLMRSAGLLDQIKPIPAAKFQEMRDELAKGVKKWEDIYLAYRRGWIQHQNRIYQCPLVVAEAAREMYRGKQSWPTTDEVKDALTIYQREYAANPTGTSKMNPGPEFIAYWQQVVDTKKDSTKNPKGASMLGRTAVDTIQKNVNSLGSKVFAGTILNQIDRASLIVLDEFNIHVEMLLNTFATVDGETLTKLLVKGKELLEKVRQASTIKPTTPTAE